jgi:DNA-binding transcriptional regulator GbsR (MarR family)
MTEITENTMRDRPSMAAPVEQFVLQWGDLGNFWGVNRSIAQIHALLYLCEEALTAEDIAQSLGIARSNVSNSLRELLNWELIMRVPVRGDRRDHYVAETDLWLISKRIAAGRKARELDPACRTLRSCAAAAEADPTLSPVLRKRLQDMLEFVESVDKWYADMLTIPHSTLRALMKLGSRVTGVLKRKGAAP